MARREKGPLEFALQHAPGAAPPGHLQVLLAARWCSCFSMFPDSLKAGHQRLGSRLEVSSNIGVCGEASEASDQKMLALGP